MLLRLLNSPQHHVDWDFAVLLCFVYMSSSSSSSITSPMFPPQHEGRHLWLEPAMARHPSSPSGSECSSSRRRLLLPRVLRFEVLPPSLSRPFDLLLLFLVDLLCVFTEVWLSSPSRRCWWWWEGLDDDCRFFSLSFLDRDPKRCCPVELVVPFLCSFELRVRSVATGGDWGDAGFLSLLIICCW